MMGKAHTSSSASSCSSGIPAEAAAAFAEVSRAQMYNFASKCWWERPQSRRRDVAAQAEALGSRPDVAKTGKV